MKLRNKKEAQKADEILRKSGSPRYAGEIALTTSETTRSKGIAMVDSLFAICPDPKCRESIIPYVLNTGPIKNVICLGYLCEKCGHNLRINIKLKDSPALSSHDTPDKKWNKILEDFFERRIEKI